MKLEDGLSEGDVRMERDVGLFPDALDVVGLLSNGNKVLELLLSCSLAQTLELASFLMNEFERSSLLYNPAFVHDQDLGAWHDSLTSATGPESWPRTTYSKSVGNDEYCNTLELIMDDSRDLGVRS